MKRAIKSCSNWLTNIIFHHVQCTIADRQQDDIRNFMRLKSGLDCPTATYLLSYIHARFAMQYCCSESGLNDTHLRCSLLLNLNKALRHKRFRQRSQQQVHRLVCEYWLASPPCAMHAALTPTLCQSIAITISRLLMAAVQICYSLCCIAECQHAVRCHCYIQLPAAIQSAASTLIILHFFFLVVDFFFIIISSTPTSNSC